MNKWQLIEITLDQLLEQWVENKNFFSTDETELAAHKLPPANKIAYIAWEPKDDSNGATSIHKHVLVSWSDSDKKFQCGIYTGKLQNGHQLDESIIATNSFIPIRRLYRRFMRLRKEILEYKRVQESNHYLKELCKVFPGALDDELLGRRER